MGITIDTIHLNHHQVEGTPMAATVKIIEINSSQVLFECPVDQSDFAYEKAAEFEEMGLEIRLIHPSVNESLAQTLGISGDPLEAFEESLSEEIEGHEGSCCFEDSKDKQP